MNIVGLSCYYHDSAACLVRDGTVVAAAQEERFNRIKNSPEFPIEAINYCVREAGITFDDIDCIGFYEKPYLKFSRVIVSHLRAWPFSLKNFIDTMPSWLQDRLIIPLILQNEIGYTKKVHFIKHHLSHAASAFLVSGFEEAALLTADAIGEWASTTYGMGRGNNLHIYKELHYPDSLGLIYTAVTTYLGFQAHRDEGKVMGLAGWGEPRYIDALRKMCTVKPDGSFAVDERFFGFNRGSRMYSARFVKIFGKARRPDDEIEQRHRDIAASLQAFIEETVISMARYLHRETRTDRLCLAGGLFLNCVLNTRILEETPFREVFIQPAAGDSGGALGVAAFLSYSLFSEPRTYRMTDAYLGPSFSPQEIKRIFSNSAYSFTELEEPELCRYVADALAKDKVVGWFQGRAEFGPRALGNRSILANPQNPAMKEILNTRVKKRESFRPYAPAVLEDRAGEFFELHNDSPFMLLAPRVKKEKREVIPAVTHVDGTARVQTVRRDTNPRFWGVIKAFDEITGAPLVVNTSFNLKGEPIVGSPEDALRCFEKSQMDCLVADRFVIEKPGRT